MMPQIHATYAPYPDHEPTMTPSELANSFATMTLPQDNSWYMDSGATAHMTNSLGTFIPLINISTPNHILIVNGHRIPVLDYGQLNFLTLSHP